MGVLVQENSERKFSFSLRLRNCNINFVKNNGSGSSLDDFISYLRKNGLSYDEVINLIENKVSDDYKFYLSQIKPKLEYLEKLGIIKK